MDITCNGKARPEKITDMSRETVTTFVRNYTDA